MIERLSDIGEFELIKRIGQKISLSSSVVKGIGDDCAVVKYTKDKYLLFTTDMIIEDVHFKKRKTHPEEIGHKVLAVNISDIAACGGIPKWAVVSAGVPAQTRYDYIRAIFTGIERLARRFNIDIVGGDTNLSRKLVISVSLLGEVEKRHLILRSGANDKDIVVLSGPLKKTPDHLTFTPRLREARYLLENFKLSSMIDISDGFLSDLNHILEESKIGAIIYESLIPHKAKADYIYKLLDIGEQFELIFTLPGSELKRLPKGFCPVGEIVKGTKGIIYVTREGKRIRVSPRGYRHF